MKDFLYNFFVWCAGSDRNILDRCGESEHIKHAGYGGLVIVPAVLGLVSMTYAISTLTDSLYLFVGTGIIWALIVFTFDRFIVSTFKKSSSIRKDIFSTLFFSRLIFAIGIGIIVSHPLILLIFDDSLEQELTNMKIEGEESIRNQMSVPISKLRALNAELRSPLDSLTEFRKCLRILLRYESSGKDTILNCGTSSGRINYGTRSRKLEAEIHDLAYEIKEEEKRIKYELSQNNAKIEDLIRESDDKIRDFKFSTNYLAREIALSRIQNDEKKGGKVVRYTAWFLMLFFILVDILPVALKTVTKSGEYDRRLLLEDGFKITMTHAKEKRKRRRS